MTLVGIDGKELRRSLKIKLASGVPESEFSLKFVQGMYDRMGVSFFKYGKVADAYPARVDAISSLFVRLIRYLGPEMFAALAASAIEAIPDIEAAPHRRSHGNTEYLMDAANFAMIEYMHPRHPDAHFEGTDSDASPGRMFEGELTQTPNNPEAKKSYQHEGD
jgi:hypothetical protein